MAQHGIDHLLVPPDHVCTQCLHQPGQKHALLDWNLGSIVSSGEPAIATVAVPTRGGVVPEPYRARAPPISLR
jgi:hypothetical protein